MSSKGAGAVTTLRFPEFLGKPLHDVCLGDVTEEATTRNGNKLARALVMGVRKEGGIVPMEERLVAGDIARYKNVQKSWFAYNPMRLNIGSIAQWPGDEEVLVSPDYVVFRCNPASLLPEYLNHFRSSRQWKAFTNESGDGGVRIRIYYRDIARMRLMLPDVSEQKKIADCLSSIDALIAAEAEKLEALKDHKKGLMQQLFPAPGETTPRLRFPEFQDAGDWQWTQLGEILTTITPPQKLPTCDYQQKGDFPIIDQGQNLIAGWTNDAGSVLMGPLPVVVFGDHTCTLKFVDFPFAQGADGIKILEPNGKMTVEYLHSALQAYPVNSGEYKRHFTDLKQNFVAFPDVRTGEQQMIAKCISSIDKLILSQNDRAEALDAHKAALLQQLFPNPEN